MQGYIITGNINNEINESKLTNKLLNKNSVPLGERARAELRISVLPGNVVLETVARGTSVTKLLQIGGPGC